MSALIAVAATLDLVGLGMLVSPEMGKARERIRRRRDDGEETTREALPLHAVPEPPTLHVIHGDGGTVLPFRPRQARTLATTSPHGVDGLDAA